MATKTVRMTGSLPVALSFICVTQVDCIICGKPIHPFVPPLVGLCSWSQTEPVTLFQMKTFYYLPMAGVGWSFTFLSPDFGRCLF